MNDNIKIAKKFTVGDWKKLRLHLINSNNDWQEAFLVFEDRINSRFFNPIEKISEIKKNDGEGFSIAIISVVLLEFLAAFEFGKIYKVQKVGLAPNEYSSGVKLLKEFFKTVEIFEQRFEKRAHYQEFYEKIRCGLVHEARTLGNNVIISNESDKNTNQNFIYFKNNDEFRLNRDLLLDTIKEFVQLYKLRLINNEINLRNKFILKMDDISGLKHVWYFMYGSNLNEERIKKRLNEINDKYLQKEKCILHDYEFTYNKLSCDGSSKANIFKKTGGIVEGVAVLILESKLDEFINIFERGYEKLAIQIQTSNESYLDFSAYTCISNQLTSNPPTEDYVSIILKGAEENNLSKAYIENQLNYFK
jgi:hypothetical protein